MCTISDLKPGTGCQSKEEREEWVRKRKRDRQYVMDRDLVRGKEISRQTDTKTDTDGEVETEKQ